MATVVGVVFQPGGKVYSFDPAGLELRWDENVICQTARGRELGRVVQANHDVPDSELTGPLKRVIRRAGADDHEQVRKNRIEAKRSMLLFRELAGRFELPVKPLSAEMVFDQSRIVFSYGSEERLDTQALQSELAKRLNRRVEVRAVGPREGARLIRRRRPLRAHQVLQPLPLAREPDHAQDGQGPGAADEPRPHHRSLRQATLLSCI